MISGVMMKTGIVGAGALGSLFSSLFLRSGIECCIFEANNDTVLSISKGLTLEMPESRELLYPPIDTSPSILAESDIIFLFVKSYSTSDAVSAITPYIKDSSILVSLQNGIGNYEIISKYIPAERIVYGITTYGATKTDSSTVKFGGSGRFTRKGSVAEGPDKCRH